MRPLEITYLLLNVPLLGWCLFNANIPAWGRFLPVLAFLFMILEIAVDGLRWTLTPAFLVTCWFLATCTWPRFAQPGRWSGVAMLGLLVMSGVLATLLPVFELPTPTGIYRTGTTTRHLVDRSRAEVQGDRKGEPRELLVQIWYPSEQSGTGKPYRSHAEVSWPKQHLALVETHSVEGVALATMPDRFPVLIFAPSWTGRRNQNTAQAEELASQGFVVVGIEHPFSADVTVFPDGREVRSNLGEFLDCASDESVAECVRVAGDQLKLRTADVRFVLDEIERLERNDPDGIFAHRLDLSRVGIFGHSFGGAVAAEVCRLDPRVKAGINYDGLVFGDILDRGIGKPFLFLMDGEPVPTDAELEQTKGPWRRELILVAENYDCIRHNPDAVGYWASVRGASHMNFCDSPYYTPIRQLSHAGTIRPGRAEQIINAYTLSFFNKYLNHNDNHLLDAPSSQYPEVEIDSLFTIERSEAHSQKHRYQLVKEHP